MITVQVTGNSPSDPDEVLGTVTSKAAEISLGSLRDIWPIRTGRSLAGLSATVDAVVGSATYTDDVKRRGSDTPIADSDAKVIGEISADKAVEETDSAVSELLDGIMTSILSENLER